MVIETEKDVILVDPMIGPIGTIAPFSLIRYKARKNPIVALPESCQSILNRVTHCLITHSHPDHLEAVNHCPTTKTELKEALERKGLYKKTHIPKDGEILEIN